MLQITACVGNMTKLPSIWIKLMGLLIFGEKFNPVRFLAIFWPDTDIYCQVNVFKSAVLWVYDSHKNKKKMFDSF